MADAIEDQRTTMATTSVVTGAIGLVGVIAIFWLACRFTMLSKGSERYVNLIAMSTALAIIARIARAGLWLSGHRSGSARSFFVLKDGCYVEALWQEFWVVASLALFGMWLLDYDLRVRKPLASTRFRTVILLSFAWSLAGLCTLLVGLLGDVGTSDDGTCWLKHNPKAVSSLVCVVPLTAFFLASVLSAAFISQGCRGGLTSSRRARAVLTTRAMGYIVAFVVCWLVEVLYWWFALAKAGHSPEFLNLHIAALNLQPALLACARLFDPTVRHLLHRSRKKHPGHRSALDDDGGNAPRASWSSIDSTTGLTQPMLMIIGEDSQENLSHSDNSFNSFPGGSPPRAPIGLGGAAGGGDPGVASGVGATAGYRQSYAAPALSPVVEEHQSQSSSPNPLSRSIYSSVAADGGGGGGGGGGGTATVAVAPTLAVPSAAYRGKAGAPLPRATSPSYRTGRSNSPLPSVRPPDSEPQSGVELKRGPSPLRRQMMPARPTSKSAPGPPPRPSALSVVTDMDTREFPRADSPLHSQRSLMFVPMTPSPGTPRGTGGARRLGSVCEEPEGHGEEGGGGGGGAGAGSSAAAAAATAAAAAAKRSRYRRLSKRRRSRRQSGFGCRNSVSLAPEEELQRELAVCLLSGICQSVLRDHARDNFLSLSDRTHRVRARTSSAAGAGSGRMRSPPAPPPRPLHPRSGSVVTVDTVESSCGPESPPSSVGGTPSGSTTTTTTAAAAAAAGGGGGAGSGSDSDSVADTPIPRTSSASSLSSWFFRSPSSSVIDSPSRSSLKLALKACRTEPTKALLSPCDGDSLPGPADDADAAPAPTLSDDDVFQFSTLSPAMFSDVLKSSHVPDVAHRITAELSPLAFTTGVIKMTISAAASGSFFIKSKSLVVKTMSRDEVITMHTILPDYVKHMRDNPGSTIARVFGVYAVKIGAEDRQWALVMENVIRTPWSPASVYDLKGSTVDRRARVGASLLKDEDYADRRPAGLVLAAGDVNRLVAAVTTDVEFFKRQQLMDYSILLACFPGKHWRAEGAGILENPPSSVVRSADGSEVFVIGIIDFLQTYDMLKRLEKRFKGWRHRDRNVDISALEPDKYGDRLIQFVKTSMLVPERVSPSAEAAAVAGEGDEGADPPGWDVVHV